MQVIATPYAVTFRHIDCAAATHAVSGLPWHCVWCDCRLPGWQCMQACCPGPCPAWAAFILCCLPASADCALDVELNSVHLATIQLLPHTNTGHSQQAGLLVLLCALPASRQGTGKAQKRVGPVPTLCSGPSTCPCELYQG